MSNYYAKGKTVNVGWADQLVPGTITDYGKDHYGELVVEVKLGNGETAMIDPSDAAVYCEV